MKTIQMAACLIAGVSSIALTSVTLAQSAAPAAAVDEIEEVVITGSRLVYNGNASPVPVSVMPADTMRNVQPTTLADGLALLPVFAGSRTQTSNPSATGAVGGGNGAANQLNLRSIGSNRNLILMDGRRVPPASTTNIVDVDIVPEMLIQRVDVVTGGVSAVYGSDAVTGVVNYITDSKFNGFKSNATYGISEYGDSNTLNLGVAAGTRLGERGHVEGSFNFYDDRGVTRRSDRDWYHQQTVQGLGTAAAPYQMMSNVRLSQTPFGGLIVGGPLNDQNFKTDGVLTPFVHGTPSGSTCCEVGGDGGYFDSNMKTPLRARQFYGRFDYDLTDTIHFFGTAAGNFKINPISADLPILANIQLSSSNAFLTAQQRTQLAAGGTTFRLSKIIGNAPRYAPEAHSDQYVLTAGLDGKIGSWNWGLSYTRGLSKLTTYLRYAPNLEREAAALDAVAGPNGTVVCNTDITNPGLRPGCVPLNPFGPTAASAAALDYILGTTYFVADTKTNDTAAQVTGSPFATWAGPVQVALSGELRTISYVSTSDGDGSLLANCTGLRFNCTQGTTREWGQAFGISPLTQQEVTEGAVEFSVPVLKDASFAKSLVMTGAARYTNYDTTGHFWTWKIGGDWTVSDSLRFRATQSRDIRAPTLDDLLTNQSTAVNFQTQQDLLTGLSPRVPNGGGGGSAIKLTAEIGETFTGGFVWSPAAIPGLSLSVDAYRILITGAIVAVQGFNPLIQAACYASGGSSPYCLLQTRPNGFTDRSPANVVTAWRGTTLNIASIKTTGIDVEANYSTQLRGRQSAFRFLAAYQPHIYAIQPGLPTIDNGGIAFGPGGQLASPVLRLTGLAHVNLTDRFGIDISEKWRSGMKLSADTTQVWINNHVDAYATTNLTLSYDLPLKIGRTQFFLNVQNLFNTVPPIAGYYGNVAVPGVRDGWVSGDNPIGRFFTVGARVRR